MFDEIRVPSPLGMLTLRAEGAFLTAVVLDGQRYASEHLAGEARERETPPLRAAREWLARYFAGERPGPEELPLAPRGTVFQRRVWRELAAIPWGETDSYGAIARRLGSSPRAVGGAVGKNPLLIVLPCHRILGAGGEITGYAAGTENKKKLLALESAGR